jgi:hypothetical protein
MKNIGQYIKEYFTLHFRWSDFLLPVLLLSLLVALEYTFNIESEYLNAQSNFWLRWLSFALFYGAVWWGTLVWVISKEPEIRKNLRRIVLPATIGILIYAFRVAYNDHRYWLSDRPLSREDYLFYYSIINQVVQAFSVLVPLVLFYFVLKKHVSPFFGFHKTNVLPYLALVLAAVPLVAWASTQADFLATYPQFMRFIWASVVSANDLPRIAAFELTYALDFVATEVFFRGFLVLAFVHWLGPKAILPMAVFYVTIHFGKPIGETISSFFGGMLLGIVSYNTRSTYGGIIVHVGLAMLMELGGWLGRSFIL